MFTNILLLFKWYMYALKFSRFFYKDLRIFLIPLSLIKFGEVYVYIPSHLPFASFAYLPHPSPDPLFPAFPNLPCQQGLWGFQKAAQQTTHNIYLHLTHSPFLYLSLLIFIIDVPNNKSMVWMRPSPYYISIFYKLPKRMNTKIKMYSFTMTNSPSVERTKDYSVYHRTVTCFLLLNTSVARWINVSKVRVIVWCYG